MTWPKHQDPDPRRADRTAKAPYNFVPLPEKVLPAEELPSHDVYRADLHTGWLDCVLTTSSPLYVRCGILPAQFDQVKPKGKDKEKAKEPADFFYTDPDTLEPVIPGSSLRGMLRALVEIVSYSKFQPVTDELKVTFRAVAAPRQDPLSGPYQEALGRYGSNVRAGYLERRDGQWFIQPARRPADIGLPGRDSYLKVKERSIPDGAIPGLVKLDAAGYKPQYHEVSFEAEARRDKDDRPYPLITQIGLRGANLRYKGVLVCSGNMLETSSGGTSSPRKNHALVLEPGKRHKAIPIGKQVVRDYLDSLTEFQKAAPFDERRGCLVEGRPIFYVEERGKVVMFGHCPNFRIPARLPGQERAATPLDFVPEELRDPSQTDLAEAMFGYVEPSKKAERPVARAGRVFISDATRVGQGEWQLSEQPITPRILAGPKPTTFQHYLVQTEPDDKSRLKHYASSPKETAVRGHKLYWHKDDVQREYFEEDKPVESNDTQHTEISPVRSGVAFRFRIYFENLSPVELGALLWLLDVAADEQYRLKLGMGKPLGLGAVKVEGTLHLTDRSTRYGQLFEDAGWATGERMDAVAAWASATRAFEEWVLGDRALNPNGVGALKDVERIKMLLFMLSWPGPPREETRYLKIEHPQLDNEYKERPVLPTPAGVMAPGEQVESTPASKKRPPKKPSTQSAPKPQTVSHPTSVEQIKNGDLLEGQVVGVESNRVVIDLGVAEGSLSFTQLDALVAHDQWFKGTYPGQALTAKALYEAGLLDEAIGGTRMRVRVRALERRHGRASVKLAYEAWLAEKV